MPNAGRDEGANTGRDEGANTGAIYAKTQSTTTARTQEPQPKRTATNGSLYSPHSGNGLATSRTVGNR